jgi:hypothetical protein
VAYFDHDAATILELQGPQEEKGVKGAIFHVYGLEKRVM